MAHTESGHEARLDPHLQAAEQAFRAVRRTEALRRESREAQLSVAESFERIADHQDRAARTYEEAARHSDWPDEYRQRAARHREFAQEDRRMAQQLRQKSQKRGSRGHPAA